MMPLPALAGTPIVGAGIGWRAPHYRALLEQLPEIGFIEVHSENFFGDGGQPHLFLSRARERYELSLHGVGLSLGSVDPLDAAHLRALRRLVDRYQPAFVSEHVCWSSIGGRHLNELLPLPYSEETLRHLSERLDRVQCQLGRRILVENISAYVRFREPGIAESEFLSELCRRSGCGLLLDINNVYVNAVNHGFDAEAFLDAIPARLVEEIHLAGFDESEECLIDTHGQPVHEAVWGLYRRTVQRIGAIPTLIEWDTAIPPLPVLLEQVSRANRVRDDAIAIAA
jgi:uncharacterized protein